MRKITILKVYDLYNPYEAAEYTFTNVVQNAEFQEVTDEQFTFLKQNINMMNKDYRFKYVVVEECTNQIENIINSISEMIDEMARKEEERKAELQKEKEKRSVKNIERKKKQLEKLKKELGETRSEEK
jgi:uncharacterized membrane protein